MILEKGDSNAVKVVLHTHTQARELDGKYGLICADCLDVLREMKDCAVDVVFTSPPYNDTGKTQSDIENKRHMKYEYVESRDDWFDWQCQVIDELLRVTKRQKNRTIASSHCEIWA